ncbi:hypothetical protein VTP01DRAFT_7478 [Rhizomucor pusillus]|uniref:uncharacterized protein n=1 Tax=Rhizomucor pusillus TaxID=4840 RepID=UPI00374336BE
MTTRVLFALRSAAFKSLQTASHGRIVTSPRSASRLLPFCSSAGPTREQLQKRFSSTQRSQFKSCWQCHANAAVEAVVCPECGRIQPAVADVNLYALVKAGTGKHKDMPTFDVDLKSLRFNFLKLQQQAHPDSFSQASKTEHEYAQMQSSILNKAYHTLRDPLARAQYLLSMRGKQVDESESLHDPELLMEIMEFREELEEAQTEEQVHELKQRNDEKYNETVQHLSSAFANDDLDQAKEYMIQLQYWDNIRRAIVDWAPGKRIEIKH